MIITEPGNEDRTIEALRSARVLTSDEAAALAEEMTKDPAGRGYGPLLERADWVGLQTLLHARYTVHTPARSVLKEYATQGEWTLALTYAATRAGDPAATAQQRATWTALKDAAMIAQALPQVRLTHESAQAGIAALQAVGLLTQDEVDTLTTEVVPETTEMADSRARTLFGPGAVVQVGELESLREARAI
jgi:hypothetical protein